MKTIFAVTAALLFVSAANASAGTTTRVKLHFHGFGCAPIMVVDVAGANEATDGCGGAHHFYRIGVRARVKGLGQAVVLGVADSDATGQANEMTFQYPFVTGGTVELEETDGQSFARAYTGTYTVLQ